jgi:hypothetical protein
MVVSRNWHLGTVRWRLLGTGGLLATLLLSFVAASAGASPAVASSGWTVQPSPNGATGNSLFGVSCPSQTYCSAVGGFINSSGLQEALAEQWNGSFTAPVWTVTPIQADPKTNNYLSGVSCTSSTACMAVGIDNGAPLAERWDGTRWTITPNPSGVASGSLSGVSCPTIKACMAVGIDNGAPLAEWWNGGVWTIQPPLSPATSMGGVLSGVSCTSATLCIAVGDWLRPYCFYIHNRISPVCVGSPSTLGETWMDPAGQGNGAWSIQPTPSPKSATLQGKSVLTGVSCISSTACTAAGYYIGPVQGATLAENWNGDHWYQPQPAGIYPGMPIIYGWTGLYGVSCTAAACTAVGRGGGVGLVEVSAQPWSDTVWTVQPSPSLASSVLSAVSCPSTSSCIAVGSYVSASGVQVTLAEGYSST